MTHPPASFTRASLVSEALGGNFHGFLSDFLWTSCSFLYEDQGEMISYIYSFPFLSFFICIMCRHSYSRPPFYFSCASFFFFFFFRVLLEHVSKRSFFVFLYFVCKYVVKKLLSSFSGRLMINIIFLMYIFIILI